MHNALILTAIGAVLAIGVLSARTLFRWARVRYRHT
jgi:hypothetical protein